MIGGLCELVLVVNDVHASVRFYRDLLGLELEKEHNDDWAWFRMPDGSRLACTRATLLFSEHSPRTDLPQHARLAGPTHFALRTDDPEPAIERLKEAGVTVHGPTHFDWMHATSWYAYDPDGNLAELWLPDAGRDE